MKKARILIILVGLFVLAGCTSYKINDLSYEEIVDVILYEKSPKTNNALQGFKYYLPRDMKILSTVNNNEVIYSNQDKYYLYVDIVSYYNKTNNDYNLELTGNRIYTRKIDYQGKKGYVIITKQEDNCFLEVMHNYGKIELLTKEERINDALAKSITILSSIEYNDKIIDSLIGEKSLNYSEETYNLSPSESHDNFLDYVQDYVDVDNEIPDEEIIEPTEW